MKPCYPNGLPNKVAKGLPLCLFKGNKLTALAIILALILTIFISLAWTSPLKIHSRFLERGSQEFLAVFIIEGTTSLKTALPLVRKEIEKFTYKIGYVNAAWITWAYKDYGDCLGVAVQIRLFVAKRKKDAHLYF